MKKNVREKLDLWASNNNWTSSHPLDDERFWDFIIEAFKSGEHAITEDDFYGALVPYYSNEDVLTENYIKYEDGIALLERFSKNV